MVRQLSESESNAVRDEARELLKFRTDLGPADLAQYTTLAEPTVRMFIRGQCPGGREVVSEISRVVAQVRAGDVLRPGGVDSIVVAENPAQKVRRVKRQGAFYDTQTVRCVAEALDYCAEHAVIGVITADFGVGKTEAVKAWRRGRGRKVECAVLEFDEFSSCDKVEFVREMCRQFDLPTINGSQAGGRMFRTLCDYLRENPCLLIFDQCETLRPRVCQVIRQIWDRTNDAGVGVIMLAAPILMARLLGGKMVDLGALTSRVKFWTPLSGITKNEMAAIVKQEGFTELDEAAFDLWYKATGGSMRRLMNAVELLKARHAGKRISERTIAGVAGHLWGVELGRAA